MKTIEYKTRDSYGNVWLHKTKNVASWKDETSPHDRYILRVCRDENGRTLCGPIVGEFFAWTEKDE